MKHEEETCCQRGVETLFAHNVVLNYEPVDDILKCKFEVNTLWEN